VYQQHDPDGGGSLPAHVAAVSFGSIQTHADNDPGGADQTQVQGSTTTHIDIA
jgi:hypothetical protein